MKSWSSPLAAFALLASLSAMACTSAEGDDSSTADQASAANAAATEDEVRASCTSPRRYFATFPEGAGACEPIAGRHGRWVPERLFADAPREVQSSMCAYQWNPAEPAERAAGARSAAPDREAIYGKLGYSNALTPSCGASSEPEVGALTPIPYLENWILGGSVGCDVCGILKDRNVWITLPPERSYRKQLQVQLSNGEIRAFQIQPTQARALTIQLPAPPAGTSYKQGRVKLL